IHYLLPAQPPDTTGTHTLSLHDALPISSTERTLRCGATTQDPLRDWLPSTAVISSAAGPVAASSASPRAGMSAVRAASSPRVRADRKSTRLNSSHSQISYAVFCLKKKNT